MSNGKKYDQTVIVIGTGFGACMTALPLARKFKAHNKGETILMLERGTWWTTPVGTVQDKEVKAYDFLRGKNQPVQFWASQNHFRGLIALPVVRPAKVDSRARNSWLSTFCVQSLLSIFRSAASLFINQ